MANKPVKLQIAALALESKTQQRKSTSDDAVKEYVDAIKNGVTLPPIDVFFDGVMYYIGDGWHRVLAYKEAGHANVFATVHEGGLRQAIFHACGANKEHGLRRTNADKKQAVMTLLNDSEWVTLSNAMIAMHTGVSDKTVQSCRESFNLGNSEVARRKGRDGKRRPAKAPRPKKTESAKEVSAPAEAEIVEDDADFNPAALPDSKIDIEALAADYKSHVNSLTKIKTSLTAMANDPKYGVFLSDKITRITTEIDGLRSTIKQAMPWEVCESCKGDGCKKCSNAGFFTKFAVANRGR